MNLLISAHKFALNTINIALESNKLQKIELMDKI